MNEKVRKAYKTCIFRYKIKRKIKIRTKACKQIKTYLLFLNFKKKVFGNVLLTMFKIKKYINFQLYLKFILFLKKKKKSDYENLIIFIYLVSRNS